MPTRKAGLGRGLEALFPVREEGRTGFAVIPVELIRPNPSQPRSSLDQKALEGLTQSIVQVGVLQPVVVQPDPESGYVLVAGERRWRASRWIEPPLATSSTCGSSEGPGTVPKPAVVRTSRVQSPPGRGTDRWTTTLRPSVVQASRAAGRVRDTLTTTASPGRR